MEILLILGMPLILAPFAFLFRKGKAFAIINAFGYLAILISSAILLKKTFLSEAPLTGLGLIYVDVLSAFFIFTAAVVAFSAALYSIHYLAKDQEEGVISARKARIYYALFNLFCFLMFFVPAVNNLGVLWVAIEMTTLISAFLVGFYNTKKSVEAAWKYIIICSVGIIFALLGTIFFSYAFALSGLAKSLNWTDISAVSHILDKNILKVAFIFVLVGYGTKAGLAPMHTWLPDAHSQAVSPVSALLSGVLLKTALYAILRFGVIIIKGVGFSYFAHLMLFFGGLSLIISSGFILVQKDLKRLLAYSSIEHIGIISIGFGLGAPLAFMGALLHIFNHAVTKSLMFFGAGDIIAVYKKHNLRAIRGVIKVMPFVGSLTLLGVFALTGFPPFAIFISEIMIIIAAFLKGSYLVAGLLLLFLTVVFGAFIHHFGRMLFGNLPKGRKIAPEPLSAKLAYLFLLLPVCALGIGLLFIQKDLIWIINKFIRMNFL